MPIQELKNAEYREISHNGNIISILFQNVHDLSFDIFINNDSKQFVFDQEIIEFNDIDKITLLPCINKVNFINQKCYKIYVYLKNDNINFKRYLGLFEYKDNLEQIKQLLFISKENLQEYKDFYNNPTNINKNEEKDNKQHSKFNFINKIILKFKKS